MDQSDILNEEWRGDQPPPSARAERSQAEQHEQKRQKFAAQKGHMGFVTGSEATSEMIDCPHADFTSTETGSGDGGGAATDAVIEAGDGAWGGSPAGVSAWAATAASSLAGGGGAWGGGSLAGVSASGGAATTAASSLAGAGDWGGTGTPYQQTSYSSVYAPPARTATTTAGSIAPRRQSRNSEIAPSPPQLGCRNPATTPPTPHPPEAASAPPADPLQRQLLGSFFSNGKPPAPPSAARSSAGWTAPAQAPAPSGELRNGEWATFTLGGPFGEKQLCQIVDMPGSATKRGMCDAVVAVLKEGDDIGTAEVMVRAFSAVNPDRLTLCQAPVWAAVSRSFKRPGRVAPLDREWNMALNNVTFKRWLDATRHPAPKDTHRGEKRLKAALIGVIEGKGATTRDGLVASSRKSREADHKEIKSKLVVERLANAPSATAEERKEIVSAVTTEVEKGSFRATSRESATNRNTLSTQMLEYQNSLPKAVSKLVAEVKQPGATCGSVRNAVLAADSAFVPFEPEGDEAEQAWERLASKSSDPRLLADANMFRDIVHDGKLLLGVSLEALSKLIGAPCGDAGEDATRAATELTELTNATELTDALEDLQASFNAAHNASEPAKRGQFLERARALKATHRCTAAAGTVIEEGTAAADPATLARLLRATDSQLAQMSQDEKTRLHTHIDTSAVKALAESAGHAELLVLIGTLQAAGFDLLQRAADIETAAERVEHCHLVLVVSRPSCSSCKVALAHLAGRLQLKITVAQGMGSIHGLPVINTY